MPPEDFYEAIKDDAATVASFATRPGLALIAGGLRFSLTVWRWAVSAWQGR